MPLFILQYYDMYTSQFGCLFSYYCITWMSLLHWATIYNVKAMSYLNDCHRQVVVVWYGSYQAC